MTGDEYQVRVTATYTDDGTGLTVWAGDVFAGLTDQDRVLDHGDEVKVAGRYVHVPATHLELVDETRPGDRVHR